MNIIVNIDKNSIENQQPKIYDLGSVVTTIQDLLDNRTITITNYRTIILQFVDLDLSIKRAFLNLDDYSRGNQYGLGQDILESDLIYIDSGSSGSGVQTVTGDFVNNSNPQNPFIDLGIATSGQRGVMSPTDFRKLNDIPLYVNNDAALAGGLSPTMFYVTDNGLGDLFLKVVSENI